MLLRKTLWLHFQFIKNIYSNSNKWSTSILKKKKNIFHERVKR